jgi:hypothetical protein
VKVKANTTLAGIGAAFAGRADAVAPSTAIPAATTAAITAATTSSSRSRTSPTDQP